MLIFSCSDTTFSSSFLASPRLGRPPPEAASSASFALRSISCCLLNAVQRKFGESLRQETLPWSSPTSITGSTGLKQSLVCFAHYLLVAHWLMLVFIQVKDVHFAVGCAGSKG